MTRAGQAGLRTTAWILALLVVATSGRAGAVAIRDNLYAVKAMGESEAWAVGNFGAIFHTKDAGRTWQPRPSGTKSPLFGVDFADAEHGWVVGKSALILHTDDGGRSWKPQKSPVPADKHFFSVRAIDAQTAWAVGDWGAIAVTRDGGTTWEDRSLGILTVKVEENPDRAQHTITEDVILYDVAFPDARHGYIVGEFGTVLATSDGGATWQKQVVGTEKTLFGVSFATPERGWAVGIDGLILRTQDGGRSWEVQQGKAGTENLEELGFFETLRNPGLYAVQVAGDYGVVVGDTGTLLTSSDGGATWTHHALPEKQRLVWLRGVSLVPGSARGFAVGANGYTAEVAGDELVPAAPPDVS